MAHAVTSAPPVCSLTPSPCPAAAPAVPSVAVVAAAANAAAEPVIAAVNPPPSYEATLLADRMNQNRRATWRELGEYHALTNAFFSSTDVREVDLSRFQGRDWRCILQTIFASFQNIQHLELDQSSFPTRALESFDIPKHVVIRFSEYSCMRSCPHD